MTAALVALALAGALLAIVGALLASGSRSAPPPWPGPVRQRVTVEEALQAPEPSAAEEPLCDCGGAYLLSCKPYHPPCLVCIRCAEPAPAGLFAPLSLPEDARP